MLKLYRQDDHQDTRTSTNGHAASCGLTDGTKDLHVQDMNDCTFTLIFHPELLLF
jgi:hypothetical protein